MTELVSLLSESPTRTPGFQKLAFIRRRIEEGIRAKESADAIHEIIGGLVAMQQLASIVPSIIEADRRDA